MKTTDDAESVLELEKSFSDFSEDIIQRSGVNINLCWHCKTCVAGCPFSGSMDYHPNQVIRLTQLGMKKEVMESSAIWICVGCHTCSTECPQAIDMSAVMDAIRQVAIEEGVKPAESNIHQFHQEVMNSIRRYGRTHKLEIMLRYKLNRRDWFSDMDVGLKMLGKRKLDLMPSKVKHLSDIRKLFDGIPSLNNEKMVNKDE